MAKLKLIADPTFKRKVGIPVAGGAEVDVEFEFKHRTKSELDTFIDSLTDRTDDTEIILEMVVGWELEDAFNRESVELLLQNYHGAAVATYTAYRDELRKAKVKN